MKITIYRWLLLPLLLLGVSPVCTYAAHTYTLGELIGLLDKNSLVLKMAKIDEKIAGQAYRMSRALPDPELEMFKGIGELPGEPAKPDLWGAALKVSIPNPLYRFFLLKSLRKEVTRAEIEAGTAKMNLEKTLKEHCFRLQYYEKIAALLQGKIERLKEVQRIIKARVSIGEAKEIDALRASVAIQESSSRLFKVKSLVSSQRTKINELLDNVLAEDFIVAPDFSFKPLSDLEDRLETLIANSPHTRLKSNDMKQKRAAAKASQYAFIQSIDLFAEREQEVDARVWRFGIGLSIPIFSANAARIRRARYARERAEIALEHKKKHLLADVKRMIAEIHTLETEIETFTDAVLKAGRQNMELSEILYKEGEVPLLVYLDSQDSFFELEQRYYQAISEWKIVKASLEALLGEEL